MAQNAQKKKEGVMVTKNVKKTKQAANKPYYSEEVSDPNTKRGIRSTKTNTTLHKKNTVAGAFDRKSIAAKVEKRVGGQNTLNATQRKRTGGRLVKGVANNNISQSTQRKKQGTRKGDVGERKLIGPIFWMMVMFAFIKDMFDILLNLIGGFTIVLPLLASFLGVLIVLVIALYLAFKQIPFTTKKTIALFTAFIIELIPLGNLIPAATLGLLSMRHFEKKN